MMSSPVTLDERSQLMQVNPTTAYNESPSNDRYSENPLGKLIIRDLKPLVP